MFIIPFMTKRYHLATRAPLPASSNDVDPASCLYRRRRLFRHPDNVSGIPLLKQIDQPLAIRRLSLNQHFHPAVRKVTNSTGEWKTPGKFSGALAKANPLHPTREIDPSAL
jgi:hypothetical protein